MPAVLDCPSDLERAILTLLGCPRSKNGRMIIQQQWKAHSLGSQSLGSSPSCFTAQLWNFWANHTKPGTQLLQKAPKKTFNSWVHCSSNLPSLDSLQMLTSSLHSALYLVPQSIHGPKRYWIRTVGTLNFNSSLFLEPHKPFRLTVWEVTLVG